MNQILIYGLAKSGTGLIELIDKRKCKLFLYDDNKKIRDEFFNRYSHLQNVFNLEELDKEIVSQMNMIVISPSISIYKPILTYAKRKKIEVVSELEFASQSYKKNLIAITGTNGKTTTTELVYNMMKKKRTVMAGNIGSPLSVVLKENRHIKNIICEVSSFQLEGITTFHPHFAVLLNISPDHIDRHKTYSNYKKEKYKIFKNLLKKDFVIINSSLMKPDTLAQVYTFGFDKQEKGAYIQDDNIYFSNGIKNEFICKVQEVNIVGKHNLENVMASIIVAKLNKISNKTIVKTLKEFVLDKHRIEFVYANNSNIFYDDSKATNILATISAVKSLNFHKKLTLVLGGSDKGYEFDNLIKEVKDDVYKIYVCGETCNKITKSIEKNHFNKSYFIANSLKEAVLVCCKNLEDNEVVLLSPATASFDEFASYEERGDKFLEYIKDYYETKGS